MKTVLAFLCILATHLPQTQFDITGHWEAYAAGQTYTMDLDAEGYALLTYGKNKTKIGGKDYSMGGEKASVTYVADFSKEPYSVSFTLHRHSTKDDVPMYTLYIKPLDENSFISVVADGSEPVFETKDAVVYTRK